MDKLKYGCLLSFVQSVKLSCELKKKSFYRAMNAIYGKIGYVASADVVVEMIKTKYAYIHHHHHHHHRHF